MKKSLSHLPKYKQDELDLIKDIILEKIPDVRMIVLFGSYARGKMIIEHTPIGRFGQPDELVGTALWLLSDAAKAWLFLLMVASQRSAEYNK